MTAPQPEILQDFPATDTPEAQAAAELWKPIERIIGDEYVFSWPQEKHAVGFNFLREEKKELHGEITIADDKINPATGRPGLVHWGSFNLSSDVTRGRLAKTLARKTPIKDELIWENMLLYACFRTQEHFRQGAEFINIADHEPAPLKWALRAGESGVLLSGQSNVLFGPGSGLKSYAMDAMLFAIAAGIQIGPFVPEMQGPVILVDYETSADEIAMRMRRIASAYGVPVPNCIHYREYDRLFSSEAPRLRAEVDRLGAVAVGLDSIAWAVQGEVTPPLVIPVFNALRSLGSNVTRIIISHITKADAGKPNAPASEYGSVFVRNAARCSWEVSRGTEDNVGNISLAMYNRKINQGREQEPVFLNVRFEDPTGPVRFGSTTVQESPELMSKAAFIDRVRFILKNGPMGVKELADELGERETRVRVELNRHRGKSVIPIEELRGASGQAQKKWALVDRAHDDAPPPDDVSWSPEDDDSEAY